MTLTDWYAKGLTPEQYMDTLDKHKSNFENIEQHFTLPNDEQFFASLKAKNLRVLILTEPWCGHCMLTVPIFLKIASKVDMPTRFLLRDENLELMDLHLTNGKSRSIPIFLFIDSDGRQVAKWGPIAPYTKEASASLGDDLPPKDDPAYEEAFKKLIADVSYAFAHDSAYWQGTYDSMKQTLQNQ